MEFLRKWIGIFLSFCSINPPSCEKRKTMPSETGEPESPNRDQVTDLGKFIPPNNKLICHSQVTFGFGKLLMEYGFKTWTQSKGCSQPWGSWEGWGSPAMGHNDTHAVVLTWGHSIRPSYARSKHSGSCFPLHYWNGIESVWDTGHPKHGSGSISDP